MSFVVTIDGPAAAGKSTTARAVAAILGFLYVDTGALYRALALKVEREGLSPDDADAVERCVAKTTLDLSGSPDHEQVFLDGEDVSREIRTPAVSELSSRLAAQPRVRRRLVEIQRGLRHRGALVGEGRDLGTVVFPDAEVKIFLDADLETRSPPRASCRSGDRRVVRPGARDLGAPGCAGSHAGGQSAPPARRRGGDRHGRYGHRSAGRGRAGGGAGPSGVSTGGGEALKRERFVGSGNHRHEGCATVCPRIRTFCDHVL
jgi:cytidylate kinase